MGSMVCPANYMNRFLTQSAIHCHYCIQKFSNSLKQTLQQSQIPPTHKNTNKPLLLISYKNQGHTKVDALSTFCLISSTPYSEFNNFHLPYSLLVSFFFLLLLKKKLTNMNLTNGPSSEYFEEQKQFIQDNLERNITVIKI